MGISEEPAEPGPDCTTLSEALGSKRNPPEGISEPSRKMSRPNEDTLQYGSSRCTPSRSVTPEIIGQAQDSLQVEDIRTSCCPSSPNYRTTQDHEQYLPLRPPSRKATEPTLEASALQARCQPMVTQSSKFVSPPELVAPCSTASQATALIPPAFPSQWNHAYPGSDQPRQSCFPPYVQYMYYPTDRMHLSPPSNMSSRCMPRYISLIDDVKVRDLLAIAVVRHRDTHDMVRTEFEKAAQVTQAQASEDASILSFSKEHLKVQNLLYGEYDELSNWEKQEAVHRGFGLINEIILDIPRHVRPRSNWKTKFNAFLTLIWIGRGIIDGIGSLPNEIRNQMAIDSRLVDAMERVYATMSEEEITNDALRLVEVLVDVDRDRGRCFAGLNKIVDMFKEVMRQGRTGGEQYG